MVKTNQTQGITLLIAALLLWNPFSLGIGFTIAISIIIVNALILLVR